MNYPTMTLTTKDYYATHEAATKTISELYREVIFTHIFSLRAVNEASRRLQDAEGTPSRGYVTGKSTIMTLASSERDSSAMLWEATSNFLMKECGWTKSDCLTTWTIA